MRAPCAAAPGLLLATPSPVGANANVSDGERQPKLGDEWRDWDGNATPDSAAPKRLFFALIAGVLLLAAGASLLSCYLVAPRLLEWSRAAPRVLFAVLASLVAALSIAFGLVALMLLANWPRSKRASRLARHLIALADRPVFWLGRVLSIDRDRLAHAFISTHNCLVRLSPEDIEPQRVLILLPRCLRNEQLEQARALARAREVEVAVVAGGEQARQRIRETRPNLVIGVACERDLLSGIRDVRHRLAVLGISNTRPHGPCRETQIDLDDLKGALDLCVHGGRTHKEEKGSGT